MAERKRKTKSQSAQAATSGTSFRLEQPKSQRKPQQSTARKAVKQARPVGGFADFLREYTVVSLAIGFVVATQVQGLVKQLVAGFVDPFSKLMFGTALSERTFTLHWHTRAANFGWGDFVYGLIDFLIVLVVIYLFIKIFRLDKLNKPKEK
jgi:large-conductance mechanosensitive channel